MKVCFIDMKNDGHHWFYNYNIMKNLETEKIFYISSDITDKQKENLKRSNIELKQVNYREQNKVLRYFYEVKNLLFTIRFCKKNKIEKLIILHLDSNLIWINYFKKLIKKNNIDIIGVQHWYPNNKQKEKALLKILEENRVIIHTDNIKKQLLEKDVCIENNIKIVNYPIIPSNEISRLEANKILKIDNDFSILYFGGTRYDKGMDILLESLKYCNRKLNVIIAGKEETFKKEFIENKLKKLTNIKYKLDLKFIADEELKYYFSACSAIVLPYRAYFNGESGIFTEGINYGKPIIAPNIIHFKEILNKNNNGIVYECENTLELGNAINKLFDEYKYFLENAEIFKKEYREKHSLEQFYKKYQYIIEAEK